MQIKKKILNEKNIDLKTQRCKMYLKKYVFSFFGAEWGLRMKAERKEEGESKSHFLMLSRRAAVLYCVA